MRRGLTNEQSDRYQNDGNRDEPGERAAPRMTPGRSRRQWICAAVAVALVALLLASVARLYHPRYGFTEMICFAGDGTGELPVLQAIPHYRHPAWNSYDGQVRRATGARTAAPRPRHRPGARSASLSSAAHPLQLDRVGARTRSAAMDSAGLRAAERPLLARAGGADDAVAAARHSSRAGLVGRVPLRARLALVGAPRVARWPEHAAHRPRHCCRRTRASVHVGCNHRRGRTWTRDEPAHSRRAPVATRMASVAEAWRGIGARGLAIPPLAGLPALPVPIDERRRTACDSTGP